MLGKQLNGQLAGAAYGDDDQMDSNYPVLRLLSSAGNTYYCKTSNWSTTGVATGTTPETVNFTLNPRHARGKPYCHRQRGRDSGDPGRGDHHPGSGKWPVRAAS